ncbi:MAG: DUF421 domain-containing protein [Bacillota bacterium]
MLILKVLSLYIISIFVMRIMGKSAIVQMTPYDLLSVIIIGTVVSEPLISTEYLPTIKAVIILVILHILFSRFTLHQVGKQLFLGEPTLLIKKGQILEKNLKRSRISVAQLLSILRSQGYPKVSDVDYVILEPIGEMSIIPKVENTPVTVQHLKISINDEGLPIAVIIDGKIQKKNLKLLDKDEAWLLEQLANENIQPSQIIYAYVSENTKELTINPKTP